MKSTARTGVQNGPMLRGARDATAAVVIVRVEAPFEEPGVTGFVEKLPDAPPGSPVTLSVTGLLKLPPLDETVIEY